LSIDWIPYPGIEPRFTIFVGGGGDEVGSAGGGRGRLLWERCAGEARWEWGGRCSGHGLSDWRGRVKMMACTTETKAI
jgi:hypothetical protein